MQIEDIHHAMINSMRLDYTMSEDVKSYALSRLRRNRLLEVSSNSEDNIDRLFDKITEMLVDTPDNVNIKVISRFEGLMTQQVSLAEFIIDSLDARTL